jgi:predicted DNA-binding ribbon-helix-helix protein
MEINGQIPNFASMLRTTCALYLRGHRPGIEEQAPKQKAA